MDRKAGRKERKEGRMGKYILSAPRQPRFESILRSMELTSVMISIIR